MIGKIFLSALDFNGPIVMRLFILSHFTYVKGVGSCRQRTASACNVFCEVQQRYGCGRQDGGFKRRERRRLFAHADDDEGGKLAFDVLNISCTMEFSSKG